MQVCAMPLGGALWGHINVYHAHHPLQDHSTCAWYSPVLPTYTTKVLGVVKALWVPTATCCRRPII